MTSKYERILRIFIKKCFFFTELFMMRRKNEQLQGGRNKISRKNAVCNDKYFGYQKITKLYQITFNLV